MSDFEDTEGASIYFSFDEWEKIYISLDDHANWCYSDYGSIERAILKKISIYLGMDE